MTTPNKDKTTICPVCGKSYTRPPCISRADNKTHICEACGTDEAMEDLLHPGRRQYEINRLQRENTETAGFGRKP